MIEFKDIGDLSPAPRTTPVPVLWVMLAVVIGCIGLWVWAPPGTADNGMSVIAAAPSQSGTTDAAQRTAATDPDTVWSLAP